MTPSSQKPIENVDRGSPGTGSTSGAASGPRRIAVLLNSASGRKRSPDEMKSLESRIGAQPNTALKKLTPKSDIGETARSAARDHDLVVAAGGDGTISAISSALAGSGTPMGVLPLGTFNFFARSLAIPLDPVEAWEATVSGTPRPVSIGEINGHHFINNASIGAYASVLQVRETTYRRWGRSRIMAYWSVIVALLTLYRPLRMTITVDGEVHQVRSPMAFIAIRPYQLEQYELRGVKEIHDGQLALYLAPDSPRLMLIWRALKVLLRRVEPEEDYQLLTGTEITIETKHGKQLIARDGERSRLTGPFRIRMLQDALSVIAPADTGAASDTGRAAET